MGWTNATQSSDIESLLRRPNLQRSTDHEFGSRHHQRLGEGRPYSPSLGHPCPGAGSSIYTQREVPLRLGIRPASSAARRVVGPRRGIPPILAVTSSKEKQRGRTTTPSGSDILFGAVTRIGSCSLEKGQGRFKRKQCVRSDRP